MTENLKTRFDHPVAETTYRSNFKGDLPTIPRLKYATLPCLYPPGSSVPCRKTAHVLVGSAERPQLKAAPPKPRGPDVTVLPPRQKQPYKAYVPNSLKVFDTKFGPMDMATVQRLYTQMRYTSYAQKAATEMSLPMIKPVPPSTTKEEKPDMVRLHGQRYDPGPEEWQNAALWDRIQARTDTDQRPTSGRRAKRLLKREERDLVGPSQHETIRELVKSDKLADVFVRKCPGYAGYKPLCPPETALPCRPKPIEMNSVMTASYRPFPDAMYAETSTFARRGPFSKTVTLTYPFNPFNKVGQEITPFVKEGIFKQITTLPQLTA